MIYTWLTLFVVLITIEFLTTSLVTVWFAFGSLCAFFTSMITDSILIQTTVFLVVSIITLVLTRPLAKKYLIPERVRTNYDKIIGMTAIVTKDIKKLEPGEVKVDGKYWTAASKQNIQKDSKVEILSIEGVKLIVKKKEEDD